MDESNLLRFITEQGIEAEIVYLDGETLTVEAAAAAVGVEPDRIAKSILFMANGKPRLVIANGTTRISYKLLAQHLNMSRKRLKLASADQVLNVSGYSVGVLPPFGHKMVLPTLVEEGVLSQSEIYAGGGVSNALLRVSVAELLRVTGANSLGLQEK